MLILVRCPFHPRATEVAGKRSRSFCQKCKRQFDLSTHAPLTQQNRSALTRYSSGNARPQSSQLAEPLWTDLGVKSGIGACELISNLKKRRKKAQAGIDSSNLHPKSLRKTHRHIGVSREAGWGNPIPNAYASFSLEHSFSLPQCVLLSVCLSLFLFQSHAVGRGSRN